MSVHRKPATARRSKRRAAPLEAERRRRIVRRAIPIAFLCATAFGIGAIAGGRHLSDAERHASRYIAAWQRGDYAAMYAELTPEARARVPRRRFQALYAETMATATAEGLAASELRDAGEDRFGSTVRVQTRLFGSVVAGVTLRASDAGVAWTRQLLFPGLRSGERLARTTTMPSRATILARDRTPLARGATRSSPLGALAGAVVGSVGQIPEDRRERLERLGVPLDAQVGTTGLELIFDDELRGTPGGELTAGTRVLAARAPRRAPALRTTISVPVLQAAVTSLAGRLGGIVALDPRSGEVLAFAGIAFSGLQPPGSTFKMVTAISALEAGVTRLDRSYPVETRTVLSGVRLENANGESCGGTLVDSFARSCNSVFAPLGVRVGARRLVRTAERLGFNRPPEIPGAATSTIPPAQEIGDDLALGSSAIGQGRVQATALQMATIAATIGVRGELVHPTLRYGDAYRRPPQGRVVGARTARALERMMLAVVRGGTGVRAQIAGVEVAGKTGTAELRSTTRCEPRAEEPPGAATASPLQPTDPESCSPEDRANDPTDTDAWFAAYAPAATGRPRVAVAVMLVGAGAGGDTAAPAAREVLVAALRATKR